MGLLKKLFGLPSEETIVATVEAAFVESSAEVALELADSGADCGFVPFVPVVVVDPRLAPCVVPVCRHFAAGLFCPLHESLLPEWIVKQWLTIESSPGEGSAGEGGAIEGKEKHARLQAVAEAAAKEILCQSLACRRESLKPVSRRRPQAVVR